MDQGQSAGFDQLARDAADNGLLAEFWCFLRHSRKWWLLPILLLLLVMAMLLMISGTAAAPFIYTLF